MENFNVRFSAFPNAGTSLLLSMKRLMTFCGVSGSIEGPDGYHNVPALEPHQRPLTHDVIRNIIHLLRGVEMDSRLAMLLMDEKELWVAAETAVMAGDARAVCQRVRALRMLAPACWGDARCPWHKLLNRVNGIMRGAYGVSLKDRERAARLLDAAQDGVRGGGGGEVLCEGGHTAVDYRAVMETPVG